MKKLTAKLSAILTAAVMTVSAAGTVFAEEEQQEAPKYTGWSAGDIGWQYLVDGEPNKDEMNIDGKMCWFSANGYYIGGYSGWVKNREYKEGLPVTGWTDNGRINEYREEYYCFNGYPVTGDLNIGDKIYSFGKTGKYTGKSRSASVAVSCAEKISADTDKVEITVENLDGKSHEIKIAQSFERLKNGKWESCKNGRVVYSKLDKELSEKGENRTFEVDVDEYSRGKFGTGFYRLPIDCGGETYYAVFEAISPIELKSEKTEYVFGSYDGGLAIKPANTVNLLLTVNSEKLQAKDIAESITVEIEQKTENGWETAEDIGFDTAFTNNENVITITPCFYSTEGYYRAVVSANGEVYTAAFRIRNYKAKAWLDEYYLGSDNITIIFEVTNNGDEPITIDQNLVFLYKKCGGKYSIYESIWEKTTNENFSGEFDTDETVLKPNKHATVNFDLSRYYDTSKLEAGEYAVKIEGIGFGEFTLTDKPTEKNLPFKNLKAEDVKEIQIEDSSCELTNTAVLTRGSGEVTRTDVTDEYDHREITAQVPDSNYFNDAVCYIRQLEFTSKGTNPKNMELMMGGDERARIILNDDTEIFLDFNGSGQVVYNDKAYSCSRYTCDALQKIAEKFTQRNLPFNDIYDNEPIQIQLKKIDGDTVNSVELTNSNDYLHSQVVNTHYFELKEVIEDYKIPADKEFQVILIYKGGIRETLTFFEPNVVMMPNGKIYCCYSSSYYEGLAEIFGVLENTASEQN